ncbi:12516_t:CDS:2, partial [Funneliformis geosporum]
MPKFTGDELEIMIDPDLEGEQQIKLDEEEVDDTIPNETCVMINSEKNFDGWWNIDQLID